MPTLDSVPGGVRPLGDQQQTGSAGDIKKSGSVALGYEQGNTVSQQSDTEQSTVLKTGYSEAKPILPQPDANSLVHAASAGRGAQTLPGVAATSTQLTFGVQHLQSNHPEALNPEFMNRFQNIQDKLHALEDISPQVLGEIGQHAHDFKTLTSQPALDSDQLEAILTQIETKLGDQSAKYNETKLEISAQDKAQQRQENIREKREQIAEAKEAKRKAQNFFALKIVASIFFPMLGAYEGINAAVRAGTEKDHGMSLFSSPEANQRAINNIKSVLGWNEPDAAKGPNEVGNPNASRSDQPVNRDGEIDFTTEGPSLAEDGMRQSDFLKMLMEAQADEEAKEKLQQAIDALQSGNPMAAAEILDSISGTITFEGGEGNETIADDFRGMIDHYLSEPGETEVTANYEEMTDDFSDVSNDTQDQIETASLQEAMIKKNPV